jgi:hypothetical protein
MLKGISWGDCCILCFFILIVFSVVMHLGFLDNYYVNLQVIRTISNVYNVISVDLRRTVTPCSLLVTKGFFSAGVQQPEREADNSCKFHAEVKNTWSHTSTPPYGFIK